MSLMMKFCWILFFFLFVCSVCMGNEKWGKKPIKTDHLLSYFFFVFFFFLWTSCFCFRISKQTHKPSHTWHLWNLKNFLSLSPLILSRPSLRSSRNNQWSFSFSQHARSRSLDHKKKHIERWWCWWWWWLAKVQDTKRN